jgi:hypothetical protein
MANDLLPAAAENLLRCLIEKKDRVISVYGDRGLIGVLNPMLQDAPGPRFYPGGHPCASYITSQLLKDNPQDAINLPQCTDDSRSFRTL